MLDDTLRTALAALLASYGLTIRYVSEGEAIPGSYWGDSEAGLVGSTIFSPARYSVALRTS